MNGASDLRAAWGWIFAAGCALLILGAIAIVYSALAAIASVLVVAGVLIAAGIVEVAHALRHGGWGHRLFYLLEGLLAIVVGLLLLRGPVLGVLAITLLFSLYLVISGIFRIVAALMLRFPHWSWTLAGGLISLALGVAIWGGWPATGFWVIGLFIGISLMMSGWSRILLALAMHGHHPPTGLPGFPTPA